MATTLTGFKTSGSFMDRSLDIHFGGTLVTSTGERFSQESIVCGGRGTTGIECGEIECTDPRAITPMDMDLCGTVRLVHQSSKPPW